MGLSACVKHGHVVPSKYCTWLRFDYVRPSILTRTLVAYSLHDELPNCQCHFSSLSFAHALFFLIYTFQVVSYFHILLVLFQLNLNLCCKSQNYIVSNLCQEHFLCDPSHLPKIPHFHSMSAANAWASAHALSMVTWYHQNIVDLLIE